MVSHNERNGVAAAAACVIPRQWHDVVMRVLGGKFEPSDVESFAVFLGCHFERGELQQLVAALEEQLLFFRIPVKVRKYADAGVIARAFGRSKRTAQRWINSGKCGDYIEIAGTRFIEEDDFRRALERLKKRRRVR